METVYFFSILGSNIQEPWSASASGLLSRLCSQLCEFQTHILHRKMKHWQRNEQLWCDESDRIWLWCSARDQRLSFTAYRLQATFSAEQTRRARDPWRLWRTWLLLEFQTDLRRVASRLLQVPAESSERMFAATFPSECFFWRSCFWQKDEAVFSLEWNKRSKSMNRYSDVPEVLFTGGGTVFCLDLGCVQLHRNEVFIFGN